MTFRIHIETQDENSSLTQNKNAKTFVTDGFSFIETSWERHKSTPHLRLKNSTMTSKGQVFSSTVPEKPTTAPTMPKKF